MTDDDLHRPRPYCDWHEDYGDVLWWVIPISEPPYVGSPFSSDWPVFFSESGHDLWWTPLPDAKRIQDQVPL